ncbi:uncharacterized protein MONBRDRAFT_6277, partial [Monosiga brevicollis MX1]
MSLFKEDAFVRRLKSLTTSQESIETLSLWMQNFRGQAFSVVALWLDTLKQDQGSRLKYMYLANDVLLNSKRRGNEYQAAFRPILAEALELAATAAQADSKVHQRLQRLVGIWQQRGVYSLEELEAMRSALRKASFLTVGTTGVGGASVPVDAALLDEAIDAYDPVPCHVPHSYADLDALEKQSAAVQQAMEAIQRLRDGVKKQLDSHHKVQTSLSVLMKQEQREAANIHERLEHCRNQLETLAALRRDLKVHLENLPDDQVLPTGPTSATTSPYSSNRKQPNDQFHGANDGPPTRSVSTEEAALLDLPSSAGPTVAPSIQDIFGDDDDEEEDERFAVDHHKGSDSA